MDDWLTGTVVTMDVTRPKCSTECDAGPFTLRIRYTTDEANRSMAIEVSGECEHDLGESFRAIVDMRLSIDSEGDGDEQYSIGNLWPSSAMCLQWTRRRREQTERLTVKYRVKILSKTNLEVQSGFRTFRVLCASKCWFVDVVRLKAYGGVFEEWAKKATEEDATQVVSHEDPADMECLLDAVQAYDQPLIHSSNYLTLLPLCTRLRLNPLLRHIEDFLLNSHLHAVRCLEISAMYRMARLYDFGTKQLGPPREALEKLHTYLSEIGGTLADLPPAVQSAFKLTSRTIILG